MSGSPPLSPTSTDETAQEREKEIFQDRKEEDDATWVTRQIVVAPVQERKCQSR